MIEMIPEHLTMYTKVSPDIAKVKRLAHCSRLFEILTIPLLLTSAEFSIIQNLRHLSEISSKVTFLLYA